LAQRESKPAKKLSCSPLPDKSLTPTPTYIRPR
jgi:hypothetical protein